MVHVSATVDGMAALRQKVCCRGFNAMFVIVAGGGRTGTQLASLLLAQEHVVHLIENRPEILARVHYEMPTEAIYEGSPTDPRDSGAGRHSQG